MMLSFWRSKDDEKRKLKCTLKSFKKALESHAQKSDMLESENAALRKENKMLKNKISQIKQSYEKLINELKRQIDNFRKMVFKESKKSSSSQGESEQEGSDKDDLPAKAKRHRGGQKGHKGKGRKKPQQIDEQKRVFLTHCPDCHNKLPRADTVCIHVVEDIPSIEIIHAIVTQYEIERQWCGTCKKEVKAKPPEVIPYSKLGINILLLLLFMKYVLKTPIDGIVQFFSICYGIKISKGAIIDSLHRAKKWLGPKYEEIKEKIKQAAVKHADETGWRIEGINAWIWAFLTSNEVCYIIEESRGKAIPDNFFRGSPKKSVLVRDDYAAYNKILMNHQSCWAHLLRKSNDEVQRNDASEEMKRLHQILKDMFAELSAIIAIPFNKKHRKFCYNKYKKVLTSIIKAPYRCDDAKRLQTRIKNQFTNLLTALLFKDVPLTNNLAERTLRPLVVTRKISGGSRSHNGANTHMINMSIIQSIHLSNLPLISTIKKYLSDSIFVNN